jgi:MinD-like ATPase involved in chromosome partitioning or flagellar assembly
MSDNPNKLTQEELDRMRKVVGGIGERLHSAPAPEQQSPVPPAQPMPPAQHPDAAAPAPAQPIPPVQQVEPVAPAQPMPPVQQPAPVSPVVQQPVSSTQQAEPVSPSPIVQQPVIQEAANEPFATQQQPSQQAPVNDLFSQPAPSPVPSDPEPVQPQQPVQDDPFVIQPPQQTPEGQSDNSSASQEEHFTVQQPEQPQADQQPAANNENLFASSPPQADENSMPQTFSEPATLSSDSARQDSPDDNLFQAAAPTHQPQQPPVQQPQPVQQQQPSQDNDNAFANQPVQPPVQQPQPVQQQQPSQPVDNDNAFANQPEPEPGSSQLLQSNLDQSNSTQNQASTVLPEPKDILMAIAIDDPRVKEDMINRSALSQMKDNTIIPSSKKARKKVSLEPLAFDQLKPGTPLIATIYSPSGGVGKSSTSMNLGVYIAAVAATMAKKRASQGQDNIRVPRVLTLDGDIDMGSLLLRLTGRLEPNIYDLLTYIDEREEQGFEGPAAWPKSYDNPPAGEKGMSSFVHWLDKLPNFNVLGAAKEPDLFWDFGPADYRNILKMLGKFYDVIIIDAGINVILESQRSWLAHANEVFLITAPDIDRIFNAAKTSRYIAQRRAHPQDTRDNAPILPALVTSDKLSVVMTRCDADAGIDLEENVKYFFPWLRDDQKFWIPDVSTEMTQANNSSRFLVLENPEYAKVISKMAKRVFQRYITTSKQRSLPVADQQPPPPQQ